MQEYSPHMMFAPYLTLQQNQLHWCFAQWLHLPNVILTKSPLPSTRTGSKDENTFTSFIQEVNIQTSWTQCKKNDMRRCIWKGRIDYCSAKNTWKIEHACSIPFCCQEELEAQDWRQQGQVFPPKAECILLATYTTWLANVSKSKHGILPTATFRHWQAWLRAVQMLSVGSDEKLLPELLLAVPFSS